MASSFARLKSSADTTARSCPAAMESRLDNVIPADSARIAAASPAALWLDSNSSARLREPERSGERCETD